MPDQRNENGLNEDAGTNQSVFRLTTIIVAVLGFVLSGIWYFTEPAIEPLIGAITSIGFIADSLSKRRRNWDPIFAIIALIIFIGGLTIYFTRGSNPPITSPTTETLGNELNEDPTLSNVTPSHTVEFTVFASQGWQDSGIIVKGNDMVSIEYSSGLWDWTKDYPDFDAAGDPTIVNTCSYVCNQVASGEHPQGMSCPLPDERIGTLVGKVGINDPFLVGNGTIFTVPEDWGEGGLSLMTNDCFSGLGDNEGEIQITITISKQ